MQVSNNWRGFNLEKKNKLLCFTMPLNCMPQSRHSASISLLQNPHSVPKSDFCSKVHTRLLRPNSCPCVHSIYQYTKRCRIATYKGGKFPKKSWLCQYFHEIIMGLDFWVYNGDLVKSQKSKIIIISWNIVKINFSYETYPPKCCYYASFGILWTNIAKFSGLK